MDDFVKELFSTLGPKNILRKTATKGTSNRRAVALVIKINSSNNAVLITYPEVSSYFFSLIKYLSAISAKHILILSCFVVVYSTEYPLGYFIC